MRIKNQEAYRLIGHLADLEHKRTTMVVIEAVREKLDRTRNPRINEARTQYWPDFGQRVRETTPRWREPWRSTPRGELLHGENGLPK